MSNFLASFFISTTTVASAVITAETQVPLGAVFPSMIFIAGIIWWLGRRFQKIEDQLKTLNDKIESVESDLSGRHER